MSGKTRVAVIYGGTSAEREVSLSSGPGMAGALDPKRFKVFEYDIPKDLVRLAGDAANLDAALIMLHGRGGEDGTMQGMLDLFGVPYQCSGVIGCALAMNKPLSKSLFRQARLPLARDLVFNKGESEIPNRILKELGVPVVVKPANEGSSVGISIVKYKSHLKDAVKLAFTYDDEIMAEEFLDGMELTCTVVGNQELEAYPIIEIIPTDKYHFFDYQAKYLPGASQEICPARIPARTAKRVQELSKRAHRALRLKGYSRSDFILTEKGPILLETNTIPGMTPTSLVPKSAQAAGYDYPAFAAKLVELALESRPAD